MPFQITGERLTSLFRPRSVALVGASDKSTFSMLAYRNLTAVIARIEALDAVVTWKEAS